MYNELFNIGPFTVYGYGLMIGIGILVCFGLAEYRARKLELDADLIFWVGLVSLLVGLVGARLLYIVLDLPRILESDDVWQAIVNGGFVVYGGLIAGLLCAFGLFRAKRVESLPYLDLAVPSIAVAQAFGRIGCFLAGCCYGKVTESRFGLVFSDSHFAPNGVRLIPTQLIASAGDFAIMAALLLYARRKPRAGRVTGLYIVLYAVGRFVFEFWRGDYRGNVGPLAVSQVIALVLLPLGIWLLVGRAGRKQKLRQEYLKTRAALTAREREEKSRAIFTRLVALDVYKEAEIVLAYMDYNNEVRTTGWIEQALAQKAKRVFCPRVVDGNISFFEITALADLKPGFKGIKEPSGESLRFDAEVCAASKCLLLMPGVAFGRDRARLGYGGGYYDRFLHKYPALPTVALAYDCQLAENVPSGKNDRKPDMIVTEKEII
jgi:phosphatidylglycerol:prolipoprotein diacylglycerol transferase